MKGIKFKGKTLAGVWITGDLIHGVAINTAIKSIDDNGIEVIPETVGILVGVDVDKIDIYSGDIVDDEENEGRYIIAFSVGDGASFKELDSNTEYGFCEFDPISEWARIVGNTHGK